MAIDLKGLCGTKLCCYKLSFKYAFSIRKVISDGQFELLYINH